MNKNVLDIFWGQAEVFHGNIVEFILSEAEGSLTCTYIFSWQQERHEK